ncbi:MAG: threonylcarbamoyl-AMP synthase [Lachnospiraceae bacterium]|nr:threonylcarbamoyl-AMP synthase [Lachnospiraceae bacterium]
MVTERIYIDRNNIDKKLLERAGKVIREGGLVAFPTETVYGLGGDALNRDSSAKIYSAKGRPSDNPLIVHICRYEDIHVIASDISDMAVKLAEALWPGPMTMIFNRKSIVPKETTGGLDTVAVRMPGDDVALGFIRAAGNFIAAPSANSSGRPSPTSADRVIEDLGGRIDMVIDAGRSDIGLESTIIDMTSDVPMILRPGFITGETVERICGRVAYDPAVFGSENKGVRPRAPGMRYRHYAPKGELTVISGERDRVRSYIIERTAECRSNNVRTGVMIAEDDDEWVERYKSTSDLVINIGSALDEDKIAANLYEALREFDDREIEEIYSEEFNTKRLGQAIMNRLLKAAGHKVVRL